MALALRAATNALTPNAPGAAAVKNPRGKTGRSIAPNPQAKVDSKAMTRIVSLMSLYALLENPALAERRFCNLSGRIDKNLNRAPGAQARASPNRARARGPLNSSQSLPDTVSRSLDLGIAGAIPSTGCTGSAAPSLTGSPGMPATRLIFLS